ncbi:MAG: Csu type fimbrial protein [Geminicoccaceae bacterium]
MAQSQDNLFVQATVGGECSVTGGTLDFGNFSGEELDISTPISFNCNAPSNISISLDGGDVGVPGGRQLGNEDNTVFLQYDLFQDEARSVLWGIFPDDSMDIDNTPVGPTDVPVFGRIFGPQDAIPGTYTDTVQITLTTN